MTTYTTVAEKQAQTYTTGVDPAVAEKQAQSRSQRRTHKRKMSDILLYVKYWDGKVVTVGLNETIHTITVGELKERLNKQMGVYLAPEMQTLIFQGREMEDERTLMSYGWMVFILCVHLLRKQEAIMSSSLDAAHAKGLLPVEPTKPKVEVTTNKTTSPFRSGACSDGESTACYEGYSSNGSSPLPSRCSTRQMSKEKEGGSNVNQLHTNTSCVLVSPLTQTAVAAHNDSSCVPKKVTERSASKTLSTTCGTGGFTRFDLSGLHNSTTAESNNNTNNVIVQQERVFPEDSQSGHTNSHESNSSGMESRRGLLRKISEGSDEGSSMAHQHQQARREVVELASDVMSKVGSVNTETSGGMCPSVYTNNFQDENEDFDCQGFDVAYKQAWTEVHQQRNNYTQQHNEHRVVEEEYCSAEEEQQIVYDNSNATAQDGLFLGGSLCGGSPSGFTESAPAVMSTKESACAGTKNSTPAPTTSYYILPVACKQATPERNSHHQDKTPTTAGGDLSPVAEELLEEPEGEFSPELGHAQKRLDYLNANESFAKMQTPKNQYSQTFSFLRQVSEGMQTDMGVSSPLNSSTDKSPACIMKKHHLTAGSTNTSGSSTIAAHHTNEGHTTGLRAPVISWV